MISKDYLMSNGFYAENMIKFTHFLYKNCNVNYVSRLYYDLYFEEHVNNNFNSLCFVYYDLKFALPSKNVEHLYCVFSIDLSEEKFKSYVSMKAFL